MTRKLVIFALFSLVLVLPFCTEALLKPPGPWLNRRYQFYIHNVTRTWHEAETVCMSMGEGVSLLTVHDIIAWGMWKHLLEPPHHESSKYWFGLTAANSSFEEFIWNGCEDSVFLDPVAPDFVPQNETCIFMWVNREVFVDVFQSKWYYGQDCLSEAPFICSVFLPERACFPRTCDDILLPTDASDCTDSLFYLLSNQLTCNYHFLTLEGLCHIWVNSTVNKTVQSVCFLPNTDGVVEYCPEVNEPVNYTIAVDSDADNCPVYMEPMDISDLFETKHYLYYKARTTWNSAREICNLQNGTLLTFDETDNMKKWHYLLTIMLLIDDGPWLGLHAPDLTPPIQLFWDDCSTAFLNGSDDSLNASCVAFSKHGLNPTVCNDSRPFICEFETRETSCQSTTCDEIILFVNKTDCDVSLCGLLDSCTADFLSPEAICQLHVNVSLNNSAICFVPRNMTGRCNETLYDEENYFTAPDNNTLVTDTKCLIENFTAPPPTTDCEPGSCLCPCDCHMVLPFPQETSDNEDVLTIEEKIEKLVAELTVDKKNTTLNKMKYVSATDNRRSSVGIGSVAGIIIMSVFGTIVLIDLSRISNDIQRAFRRLLTLLGLQGLLSASKSTSAPKTIPSASSETASSTATVMSSLSVSTRPDGDTVSEIENTANEFFEMDSPVGKNIPPASTNLA